MSRTSRAAGALLATLLLGFLIGPLPDARAQEPAGSVTGRVMDASSQEPIAGALVSLVGSGGAVVRRTLTSESGAFTLEPVGEGSYRLRVERIGYESWISPSSFSVPAGEEVSRRVRVGVDPVRLPALRASSCVSSPSEIPGLAAVWSEIRKALRAQRVAATEARLRFILRESRQILRGHDGFVLEDMTREWSGAGGIPYASASPEQLSTGGYAQVRGDSLLFYGPDARTLLSPSFQATHCFHAASPDSAPRPGWIGLAFEPVAGRALPEVEGTLWVDRKTAALELLEFRYVDLPGGIDGRKLGGDVVFERLESGLWIVRRWTLRVPYLSPREVALMEAAGWEPGEKPPFSVKVKDLDRETGEVVTRTAPAAAFNIVVESGEVVEVESR